MPHRGPVVGSVAVDEAHPADREAPLVQALEHAQQLDGPPTVRDQPTSVGLTVEAQERDPDQAQVVEQDRAAGMPRAASHQLPGGMVESRDRAAERLLGRGGDVRGGERQDQSEERRPAHGAMLRRARDQILVAVQVTRLSPKQPPATEVFAVPSALRRVTNSPLTTSVSSPF